MQEEIQPPQQQIVEETLELKKQVEPEKEQSEVEETHMQVEPVHEEEHHPEQVEGFTDKLLALHDLEHVFEGELDEDAPLDFLDEAAETLVVGDDGWVMVEVQSKRR